MASKSKSVPVPEPPDWSTRGKRLKWAIKQQQEEGRRRGVRLFQKRMEQKSAELEKAGEGPVPGVALSSIYEYLSDKGEPSQRFWDEAARILHVRPVWLIYDEGEPTEEEALVKSAFQERMEQREDEAAGRGRAMKVAHDLEHQRRFEVEQTIGAELGAPLDASASGATASAALFRAFGALYVAEFYRGQTAGLDDKELRDLNRKLARRIGKAAIAPWRALKLNGTLHRDSYHDYLIEMGTILARLARETSFGNEREQEQDDGEEA